MGLATKRSEPRIAAGRNPIRMDQWYRLQNIIASLETSTFFHATCRGVSMWMDGRCSSYVSHRSIKFFSAEFDYGEIVRISNTKYEMLVGFNLETLKLEGLLSPLDVQYDVVIAGVPAAMLGTILKDVSEANLFVKPENGLVDVAFCYPKAVDFDANGKPIFKPIEEVGEPKNER